MLMVDDKRDPPNAEKELPNLDKLLKLNEDPKFV
jgi:hypothetical protein